MAGGCQRRGGYQPPAREERMTGRGMGRKIINHPKDDRDTSPVIPRAAGFTEFGEMG